MVSVPLAKIVANPFRDLTLFPLDEAQVEKLMRSMDRHGFFGGIRARQVDSLYQIGMGHHRVEAARRKKLGSIDIDIRDMSDADMIRLMTSENAIQAGSRAPAIMNEVSAAVGQLAMAVLSSEMLSQIRESIPEIAQCFQNQRALDAARGTLENGEGIGEPLIRSYLGGGDPDDCPRSKHQISDGLAALKSAGLYTKVISEVRDRIAAEAAEQERQAEQAEREAERAKSEAKSAAERRNQRLNLRCVEISSVNRLRGVFRAAGGAGDTTFAWIAVYSEAALICGDAMSVVVLRTAVADGAMRLTPADAEAIFSGVADTIL